MKTVVDLEVQVNGRQEVIDIKKEMLTVKDIKESLGCGINRAYDIVNQKDFPKVKIGKRFYIPKDEYDKWIHSYLRKEYKI